MTTFISQIIVRSNQLSLHTEMGSNMTEESSLESKVTQLSKKIDDQGKFTRALVLICTGTILAVHMWTVTETFTAIPAVVLSSVMENMELLIKEYRALDTVTAKQERAEGSSQNKTIK